MWQEHLLSTRDGKLLYCEAGAGPAVVFLHGGPGDEHRSLRPLAEPLAENFHCILYDQRGSGGSTLERLNEHNLHPDRFVEDLEDLRRHLGLETLTLVGHSWGAILALLYGGAHPQQVGRLALLGMGPLNQEMAQVARANRLKPLSPQERQAYRRLTVERQAALEAGDAARMEAVQRERMRLAARSLFYHQDQVERFLEDWFKFEPYRNWRVNPLVGRQMDAEKLWAGLLRIQAPALVLYGYQDFEPITQAYLLREYMPDARPFFINECGHVPWLEQREAVESALLAFLKGGAP